MKININSFSPTLADTMAMNTSIHTLDDIVSALFVL